MNKLLSTLFFSILTVSVLAQEKRITSELEQIKVYMDGAEVYRKAKCTLAKGNTLIIVEGIANEINSSSIQVKVNEGVKLLSVSHQVNNKNIPKKNKTIQLLEDSIETVSLKIKEYNVSISVLYEEEQILKANRLSGSQNTGVNVVELQKILDLNRIRMMHILSERNVLNGKIFILNQTMNRLKEQIAEESAKLPWAKGEIRLLLSAQNPTNCILSFSYLALVAGWIPVYDIYTDGVAKTASLVYKAEVAQNTGEIWENVKLSLSSAIPATGIDPPIYATRYLGYNPPTVNRSTQNQSRLNYANSIPSSSTTFRGSRVDGIETFIDGMRINKESADNNIKSKALDFYTGGNGVSIDFDIDIPYSIPNDGKGQIVSMKEYEMPIQYEYYCLPFRQKSVFLTGLSTDWQKINILQGRANVFFRNNFTGNLILNPEVENDTLRLSFGKDKKILVERKVTLDISKKSFFGGNKTETFVVEIILNNTNVTEIPLRLIDQVPISKYPEIKVSVDDVAGAEWNRDNGKLEWKITLKPNEVKKIRFLYTITSPKDKKVY